MIFEPLSKIASTTSVAILPLLFLSFALFLPCNIPTSVALAAIVTVALIIATPVGVGAAIYLTEYAKQGRLTRIIEFTTETLAGIPSIIYGLFGSVFFYNIFKVNYSLLTGALTLSIMVLPTIIVQAVCGKFTVFRCVSVDEPMCYRVVISALEVIEPSLGVVVVPTVAQRVDFCLGAGA